jgi:transcriptional regulator with XRE-family HTH domain
MTQQQLAEFADLNIRNVQRIEAGEIDVLLSTAVRISRAIGCPLEMLIPKKLLTTEVQAPINFWITSPILFDHTSRAAASWPSSSRRAFGSVPE